MTKYFFITLAVLVVLMGAVWYWALGQNPTPVVTVATTTPTTAPTPEPTPPVPPVGMYSDTALGFSITLPTALTSTTSSTLYRVDAPYSYTALGQGNEISGVKFTIPGNIATGTNLSNDSYVSVEHLAAGQVCDAATFLGGAPRVKSQTVRDGTMEYSMASSTDAAAGNRYEEYVYALAGTNPCTAVRYFIHYGAIGNYPKGTAKEFDKAALLAQFDRIRATLTVAR